jgi:hypothetical protein
VEAIFLYIPFFGGAMGIGGINLPTWFGREMTKPEYFILILIVFFLLLLLDRRMGRSWIGLAWASIREDEQAAGAMGVDVVRFKVLAFILGSAIAGLAGGFYAHFLTEFWVWPIHRRPLYGCLRWNWNSLGADRWGCYPGDSAGDLPAHHGVSYFNLWSPSFSYDAFSTGWPLGD